MPVSFCIVSEVLLVWMACGAQPNSTPVELKLPAPIADAEGFEDPLLRAIRAKATTGTICPLVDGYHDPTKIVYDEARFWRQVADWNPQAIGCGVASCEMETTRGVVQFAIDLSAASFGKRFHYRQCIEFLEARPSREQSETRYVIRGLAVGRERPLRIFQGSPWEHDLSRVIRLLMRAKVKEAVPSLLALLDDPYQEIRTSAAFALGQCGTAEPEVIAALARAASGADSPLARAAGAALANLGPAAMDSLTVALASEAAIARRDAAAALGNLGPKGTIAVPDLVRLLEDESSEVRSAAAQSLAHLRADETAAPALMQIIRTTSGDRRAEALSLIRHFGYRGLQQVRELLKHPDVELRCAVVAAMRRDSRFPDALELLGAAAVDADARVRLAVARELGQYGSEAAIVTGLLVQLLEDSDRSVRNQAAQSVGRMGAGGWEAVPALIKALTSKDRRNGLLRISAAEALGRIGPQARSATPALIAAIKSKQRTPAAIKALGEIGAPLPRKAAPVLMPLLRDSDPEIQIAASETLEQYRRHHQTFSRRRTQ